MEKFDNLREKIKNIEKVIEFNMKSVDDEILPNLNLLSNKIKESKEKLDFLQKALIKVTEEENLEKVKYEEFKTKKNKEFLPRNFSVVNFLIFNI